MSIRSIAGIGINGEFVNSAECIYRIGQMGKAITALSNSQKKDLLDKVNAYCKEIFTAFGKDKICDCLKTPLSDEEAIKGLYKLYADVKMIQSYAQSRVYVYGNWLGVPMTISIIGSSYPLKSQQDSPLGAENMNMEDNSKQLLQCMDKVRIRNYSQMLQEIVDIPFSVIMLIARYASDETAKEAQDASRASCARTTYPVSDGGS
jgi:hypothetical protein